MTQKQQTLTQRGLFTGERRFQLRDDRYLFIQVKGVKKEKNFQIDLMALNPKSKHKLTIAWRWLLATGITLLTLFLALHIMPHFFGIALDAYALPFTISLSLLAFIFAVVGISASYRELIFVSCFGKHPLVRLLTNKPDRKTFQDFTRHLENCIEKLSQHVRLDTQRRLAGEIKMLRRLAKNGVLSIKDYENLKAHLFKLSDSTS